MRSQSSCCVTSALRGQGTHDCVSGSSYLAGMAFESPCTATPSADTNAALIAEYASTLVRVLLEPEKYGLSREVWYALSGDSLLSGRRQHSLAARLGINPQALLWTAVWPAVFGERANAARIRVKLESARADAELTTANSTVQKMVVWHGAQKVYDSY